MKYDFAHSLYVKRDTEYLYTTLFGIILTCDYYL